MKRFLQYLPGALALLALLLVGALLSVPEAPAQQSSVGNVPSPRVTDGFAVLSPTSQQTNYLVTLYPNGFKYVIHTANTNVSITFSNVSPGHGASVFMNALTSSVSARIALPASLLTNINYIAVTTNGQGGWHNYESLDGTSTNITVIFGALHRR